jgi:hypothetical protein
MSDIFICYSSKDREVADRLLTRMRAEGWTVWMDTHTLTGARWRKEIQNQLAQARCVVALWSAAAEESDYVMDGADDARKRGILVPALIEAMNLPVWVPAGAHHHPCRLERTGRPQGAARSPGCAPPPSGWQGTRKGRRRGVGT